MLTLELGAFPIWLSAVPAFELTIGSASMIAGALGITTLVSAFFLLLAVNPSTQRPGRVATIRPVVQH